MNSHLKTFALVAAMALVIPAGAVAKRPEGKPDKGSKHGQSHKGGKGKGKAKGHGEKFATVNFKGVVDANDGTTMTVTVGKASGHGKACKDSALTFDVASARFHTADNNASGDMDAGDFEVGHAVKVRAKVPKTKGRKLVCSLEGTIAAKAVHNHTTPQVDDDEATDEEETAGDEEGTDDEDFVDDEDVVDDEELLDEDDLLDEEEGVDEDEFPDDGIDF